MSRVRRAASLIREAAKRPGDIPDALGRRAVRVGLRLARRLPAPARRLILTPLGQAARRALRRPGDHGFAGRLWVVTQLLGPGSLTVADVDALSRRPHAPATLAGIVLMAARLQAPAAVLDQLLDRIPEAYDEEAPDLLGVRSRVDQQLGRYSGALERLELIARSRPDHQGWQRRMARIRGHLTVSEPTWRPDLPGAHPIPLADRHPGRVLHLLSNSLPHRLVGYTVRAQNVARCQQAVGLDPRMVTRAGFPGNAGVERPASSDTVDGVTYRRIAPSLPTDAPVDEMAAVTARGLARLAAELRPAALQPTTDFLNAQAALAVGERLDLPVIYEVRGFLEETWASKMGEGAADADKYLRAKAVETACMRRATGIVTLSETMRDDILERGGIDPDRVVVVPNAVDVERFVPGPRDEAFAAGLGIAPDEVVVGYISSFTAYEGIGYLIRAVARLRRDGRRARLLLVGDGDERANLEAIAAEEGLLVDGGVIFTGRVPHETIESYYRTIDVFVVPRTNDRVSQLVTPLKPYEAMAMAKALVVSAVPALLEIISHGETGRSAPPEDADGLAAAIDALLDDPAERERLGIAARAWVTEHRTWAANGQRYLDFYRRLGIA